MRVLFVCLGNICRSPLLHQLLKKKVADEGLSQRIGVDSCAITSWNLGEGIDERTEKTARNKGIILEKHKAKLFHTQMFLDHDYIFVVTKDILNVLSKGATAEEREKIFLATHFSHTYKDQDIPDPYHGDESHFEEVFTMSAILIDEIFLELKKHLQ